MPATGTKTLKIERVFDCTPEELWEAWTTPEEFAQWIAPLPGRDAEVVAFEPRPGGRLAWIMACPVGEAIHEDGWFEVVDRPHELVIYQAHEHPEHPLAGIPLTMRVRFTAEGDRTRMLFEQSGFPADFPMDGAAEGTDAVLTKLAAVVAARRAR